MYGTLKSWRIDLRSAPPCTLLNADRKTGHSNLCKTVQNKPRKYTLPFTENVVKLWYLAERESSTRFEMVKGIAPPELCSRKVSALPQMYSTERF